MVMGQKSIDDWDTCIGSLYHDSTAQIVGYVCGVKPFFRSLMPLCGNLVE